MNTTYTHIGEVISFLRKKKRLSQEECANGVCTREYLIKIEKGQTYPTTIILNGLCNTLGIDIYEEYALILRHGGFERHNMITELNNGFSYETEQQLPALIEKCENLFPNCDGELYQYLCYAKAICAMDIEDNPTLAQEYALRGILSHHPSYTLDTVLTSHTLSNIDLSLIYYYITCLCEFSDKSPTIVAYYNLYQYLISLLNTSNYIVHKKYHFEINLLTSVVINMIHYNTTEIPISELYTIVCKTIDVKKTYHYSNAIPNLLFDKCYLCHKLGYMEEYNETLHYALSLSEFYLGKEKTQRLQSWLFSKI